MTRLSYMTYDHPQFRITASSRSYFLNLEEMLEAYCTITQLMYRLNWQLSVYCPAFEIVNERTKQAVDKKKEGKST